MPWLLQQKANLGARGVTVILPHQYYLSVGDEVPEEAGQA